MKTFLFALAMLASLPAFANDATNFARNRYFCYYRDSQLGYTHGAGGMSIGVAKSRALRACQESNGGGGEGGVPHCTFVGCRTMY